jgi:chorismate mutase/prephenate dehydrogenase
VHRSPGGSRSRERLGSRHPGPYAAGGVRLSKAEIDLLRKEIERIDEKIIELVSQRRQVAFEIGLVKRKDGLPVKDKGREKKIREAFAKRARSKGSDPDIAVKIAELLIFDSIVIQSRKTRKDLAGKNALVVGGSGRMGAWICRRLSNRGATVKVWDPRGRLEGYENVKALGSAVRGSDITVIASPLGTAPAELRLVLKANPEGLVFDVCSVKSHIAKQLRAAARSGVKVASVHPMFGPNVPTPKGRNVIVCDCGNAEGVTLAAKLFSGAGANVVRVPLEKHDELMAYVLGLSHLSLLLFASTLADSGKSLDALRDAQGPSFERMLAASRELSRESVRVYHDIQALNPNTRPMFAKFVNSVKFLKMASIQKDPARFRKLMESNRKYLEVR